MAELSVGVSWVDAQHEELVSEVGRLLEEARRPVPGEALGPALEELQRAVVAHFQAEEEAMERHGYDGLSRHKESHAAFVAAFLALKADLVRAPAGDARAARLQGEVADWLALHIKGFDRPMGRFLIEAGEL